MQAEMAFGAPARSGRGGAAQDVGMVDVRRPAGGKSGSFKRRASAGAKGSRSRQDAGSRAERGALCARVQRGGARQPLHQRARAPACCWTAAACRQKGFRAAPAKSRRQMARRASSTTARRVQLPRVHAERCDNAASRCRANTALK